MSQFETREINLHYELQGVGIPLVLISGFTCDSTFWTTWIEGLKGKFQVLTIDNIGSGQSSSPDVPYSVGQMAEDTLQLIQHLNLKKPHILGHSMGGCIAQVLAYRFPEQIGKLILANSLIKFNPTSAFLQRTILAMKEGQVDQKFIFLSMMPWLFSEEVLLNQQAVDLLLHLDAQTPHPQSNIGFKRQLDALTAFDSNEWIEKIKKETLVIGAENDLLCPKDSLELSKRIEHAKYIELPKVGHVAPLEKPAEFIQAIYSFL